MKAENRRYIVLYKDGKRKRIRGYENLPEDRSDVVSIHRVRNKKGSKEKISGVKAEVLSEYVCFADLEFTCGGIPGDMDFDSEYGAEVLSIGIVAAKRETGEIIDTFYSIVKPKHNLILTGFCKDLTKITQEEVDRAKSFEEVMQAVVAFYTKYKGAPIYTYGSEDRHVLRVNMGRHEEVSGLKQVAARMETVDKALAKMVFGKAMQVSLEKMKNLCNISGPVNHNALADAKDLCQVWFRVQNKEFDEEAALRMHEEIKWKAQYYQYRRFSSTEIPQNFIFPSKKDEFAEYVSKLIYYLEAGNIAHGCLDNIKLLAFCDDLRKFAGIPEKGYPGQ